VDEYDFCSSDDFSRGPNSLQDDDLIVDINEPLLPTFPSLSLCSSFLLPSSQSSGTLSPPPSNTFLSTIPPRNARTYSFQFKTYAVRTALALRDVSLAAFLLSIPRTTLHDWMNFRGFDPLNPRKKCARQTGGGKKQALPLNVEREIAADIRSLRSKPQNKKRVTLAMVRTMAIAKAKAVGIDSFVGSNRWIYNFSLRQGFRYRLAKRTTTAKSITQLSEDLQSYINRSWALHTTHVFSPEDVISCDEFSVSLAGTSGKTMVDDNTNDAEVNGQRYETNHITALCAANAAGHVELVMFIFKAQTGDRCPNIECVNDNNDVMVRYTKSSFITEKLYIEFLSCLFSRHKSRPILFSHDFLPSVHCTEGVRVLFPHYHVHELLIPGKLTKWLGALDNGLFTFLEKTIPALYSQWLSQHLSVGQLSAQEWRCLTVEIFLQAVDHAPISFVVEGFYRTSLIIDPELRSLRPIKALDKIFVPTSPPTCSVSFNTASALTSSLSSFSCDVCSLPFVPSSESRHTRCRSRARSRSPPQKSKRRQFSLSPSRLSTQHSTSLPRRSMRKRQMSTDAVISVANQEELKDKIKELQSLLD
jgi:hypothetical protein